MPKNYEEKATKPPRHHSKNNPHDLSSANGQREEFGRAIYP